MVCGTPLSSHRCFFKKKKKREDKARLVCAESGEEGCRSLEGLNAGDVQPVWNSGQLQAAWAVQKLSSLLVESASRCIASARGVYPAYVLEAAENILAVFAKDYGLWIMVINCHV